MDRCTCGPSWVYERGCGFPHRDDSPCAYCEEQDWRENNGLTDEEVEEMMRWETCQ